MKAVVCKEYGPISNLEVRDVEPPKPGAHEVVIAAEAIGVNYPDGLLVQGLYQAKPPTPFVPGMEVAGRITAIGEAVSEFEVGTRVAASTTLGGYAEQAKVHKSSVVVLPDKMDAADATALLCGYGTAYHALKQRAAIADGETLVVTGAAGLTGLSAVQLGKAMGARVIAVASSEEKRQLATENGADEALGYENLKERLKEVTSGNGADVVFDVVGGEVFEQCARAMAWKGRLLVIGFASGAIPKFPVNLALVKGYSVVGVFWGSFVQREPDENAKNLRELVQMYGEGRIKPHVEARFPLSKAADALQYIHDRKATGKVVLAP